MGICWWWLLSGYVFERELGGVRRPVGVDLALGGGVMRRE
jgi:hypothetical protein